MIGSTGSEGLDQKDCPICKSFRRYTFSACSSDRNFLSVGMSDFEAGEQGKKMPCTHLFHRHCLETWLETNGSCPVCRHRLDGAVSSSSATGSSTAGQVSLPPTSPSAEPSAEGGLPPSDPDGSSSIISGRSSTGLAGATSGLRTRGAAAGTGARPRGRDGQEDRDETMLDLE
jgi:hypothetical protein